MFKNELNNNYIVQLFSFFKVLMISNILVFLRGFNCIYLVSKSILIVLVLQKDNFKGAKIRTVEKCII